MLPRLRSGGTVLALLLAGCGALTPPRPDGGTGGGATGGGLASGGGGGIATGGGGGGMEAPWNEVALQVPAGTLGTVQQLAARPGEVFALVANRYVLRSAGGRFNEVLVFDMPVLDDLEFSGSGAAAVTVFGRVLACSAGCESGNAFDEAFIGASTLALCGSADALGAMTRSPDAGAALYEQLPDAGWGFVSRLNVRAPLDCARTTRGELFVAGQGGVGNASSTQTSIEVPDTSGLGRVSANEQWTKMGTDGTWVFAASARGAVARRPEGGGWTVASALDGEISALTVESPSEIWVIATGVGLARFDGTRWSPAGAGPALLTSFDALAVESSHVYVGGKDAAGVARVFRRLR
ncbi:MAG: hypothetical protein Q8N23_31735 [Archangium sp.]|nr:hypothetical protein [Archangium sp.]MDP3571125.1 hypothetical protein [Archangium sp.]